MTSNDELRYVQAFARIIGVKEDDALEYAQRNGIGALVENATQLLTTPSQRENHQAFLYLYRMSAPSILKTLLSILRIRQLSFFIR